MDQVDELVARGDVEGLTRLAESRDKAVAKAARRGLHLLRTRGHKVAQAPAAAAPSAARSQPQEAPEELPSLASSYDGSGERAIWMVRLAPDRGVHIFEAYVHERFGITAFRASEASRKAYRKVVRELSAERKSFRVVDVPWSYARAEVEEAYRKNLATRRAAPIEFTRMRPQLGKVDPFGEHPALAIAPGDAAGEAGAHLHELPEVRSWIPEREELERVAMRLGEVEQSQLLVTPQQKIAARAEAVARVARESFEDPERRARTRRRLLDTAYLLTRLGPEREADARLVRAVADEFAEDRPLAGEGAFARRLFEKCFPPAVVAGEGQAAAERSPSGLIVPP
jgi:hypothetical protein